MSHSIPASVVRRPALRRIAAAARQAALWAGGLALAAASVAPAGARDLEWDGDGLGNEFSWQSGFPLPNTNWRLLGAGNSGSVRPVNGDTLTFRSVLRLSPVNDFAALSIAGLTFAAGAGAYDLGGNALTLTGNYANTSAAAQKLSLAVTVGADQTWSDSGAGSTFAGAVTLGNHALTVNGRIAIANASLDLVAGSTGTGSLTLNSGASASTLRGTVGSSAGATGSAVVSGGATWTTSDRMYAGLSGNASLLVQGGGQLEANESYVAYFGTSTATATVTGAGSAWNSTADMKVGVTGHGTLNIKDGGRVSNRDGYLGYVGGAVANVEIAGAGATWANSRNLVVGLSAGTSSTLSVGAGGVLSVGEHLSLNAGGTINLAGGELGAATASRAAAGSFQWSAGTLALGTLNLGAADSLLGQNVSVLAGRTLRVGSALTVGAGSLAIGAGGTLDLDANASFSGNLTNHGDWVLRSGNYSNTVIGTGRLVKQGSGTVVYTGIAGQQAVAVHGGIFALGNGGNFAAVSGVQLDGGTLLRIDASGISPVGGSLGGTGRLQTTGAGSARFTGSAALTGGVVHSLQAATTQFSGGGLFDLGPGTVNVGAASASSTVAPRLDVAGATLRVATLNVGIEKIVAPASAFFTVSGQGSRLDVSGQLALGPGAPAVGEISSGGIVTAQSLRVGSVVGATGDLKISGAGSLLDLTGTDSLSLGGAGAAGRLQVLGGGFMRMHEALVADRGGGGELFVSGIGSSVVSDGAFKVGGGGRGALVISSGGALSNSHTTTLGGSGQAAVDLDGPGSRWTTSTLNIGVSGTGSAVVTVSDGALLRNTDWLLLGSKGKLTVDGGIVELNAAGASVGSTLLWNSGEFRFGSLSNASYDSFFGSPMTLTFHRTLQVNDAWDVGGGRITLDGGVLRVAHTSIFAGKATPFTWRSGTLELTSGADLVLSDDDYFTNQLMWLRAGQTVATGGNVVLDPGTALLLSGGNLRAAGLRLQGGSVVGLGGALDMNRIGVLSGLGTVSAAVQGGADSSIEAGALIQPNRARPVARGQGASLSAHTQALVMGDANRSDGFVYEGAMSAYDARIVLLSADRAVLGRHTMLANSRLEAGNGIELGALGVLSYVGDSEVLGAFHNEGRVEVLQEVYQPFDGARLTFLSDVSGRGSFAGDIVFKAGYDPGNSPASVSFGGGRVQFDAHSVLTLEIGGATPGSGYDQLLDIGELQFDGQLVLAFVDGYAPTAGTVLHLLQFDHAFGAGLAAGRIQVTGLDPRLLDLSGLLADGNIAAVPEPETYALMLFGLAALAARARRRR